MASQITSLMIVYSIFYSGADQSKHQSSASLAFVWGIHRSPVNSPHKGPVTRKMFPFDDVMGIRINWIGRPILPSKIWIIAVTIPYAHYLKKQWFVVNKNSMKTSECQWMQMIRTFVISNKTKRCVQNLLLRSQRVNTKDLGEHPRICIHYHGRSPISLKSRRRGRFNCVFLGAKTWLLQ